ncbi:hypothetical protein SFRURICE_004183 [Spodoptera frugiperda]|nr:hypothetical protein SFRURICE_004183 [Spodoptera frugiperda]
MWVYIGIMCHNGHLCLSLRELRAILSCVVSWVHLQNIRHSNTRLKTKICGSHKTLLRAVIEPATCCAVATCPVTVIGTRAVIFN